MSDPSNLGDQPTLSPQSGRRLNEICRRFETAWLSGQQRPRIEDFQAAWAEADGWAVLRELIAVEWELRVRQGERPTLAEYQGRFPGHDGAIASLYQQTEADPPAEAPLPKRPPDLQKALGSYRLLREVGRGGMGIVYEALHETLGRRVALKVLRTNPFWEGQQVERFLREARTVAALRHPHIVTIHDVGQQDGTYFFAMQYVDGRSLAELLAGHQTQAPQQPDPDTTAPLRRPASVSDGKAEPVTLDDPSSPEYLRAVARLALQVAQALQHAHDRGVLHRDVKPSNLLLDSEGCVWLTDFGLARSQEDLSLTGSDQILGTPRYLPPEALEGKWQPASDVYSLGLTLYELLTLRPAFDASNRLLLLDQMLRGSPPPPRQINPLIPPALEAIVSKAIDHDPARRFRSARELAAGLQQFLNEEPGAFVSGSLPTESGVTRGRPRLRSRVVWLVCVAAALLAVGLFVPRLFRPASNAAGDRPQGPVAGEPGSQVPSVSTFLGNGLQRPYGMVFDACGNLYVANLQAGTVGKVTPEGTVSTFASGLTQPISLAIDKSGNLYVGHNLTGVISKVTPEGGVSPFASGLNAPGGLAFDSAGNLYAANHGSDSVSKVTPGGTVSTFATGLVGPIGLAFDSADNLYVATNRLNTISKVTPDGTVSIFTTGQSAPAGLAFDSAGNLYVGNLGSNTISKVTPTGAVSTFIDDTNGLQGPTGLAFDPAGNLYISNQFGHTISKATLSRAPTKGR